MAQFEREFERREQDVAHRVQGIADAEATVRMAIDLSRPQADVSVYVNDARGVSQSHQLDFLDFVGNDGSIISSDEWPARFGYKIDWLTQPQDWAQLGSFLMKVDTQDGPGARLDGGFARARWRQESLRAGRRDASARISSLRSFCLAACARCFT